MAKTVTKKKKTASASKGSSRKKNSTSNKQTKTTESIDLSKKKTERTVQVRGSEVLIGSRELPKSTEI